MLSVKKIFAISTLSLCMSLAYADNSTTSVNQDLENLSNQMALQNKVKEYDNLLNQLSTQVESNKSEINAINERIKTAKKFISDIDPYSESNDNLNKLNQIVDVLVARKEQINKDISDKNERIKEINTAKSNFIDNQARLATQDKSNSVMQTAIEQSRAEYSKLQEQKKALESQAADFNKILAEQKANTEKLKKQKDDYDSFIKKVDADIKTSQDILDKKKSQAEEYKKQITSQESQNAQLVKTIEQTKAEYQAKTKEQKQVQKDSEDQLNFIIDEGKQRNQLLNAEKQKIMQQNDQLVKEIENSKKIYQENVESREKMTKRINVLETDLANSKKKIKELNEQTAALFEQAKRSLLQNNRELDDIEINKGSNEIKNVNVNDDDIKPKKIDNNAASYPVDEKILIVNKSLSPNDRYVQNGQTTSNDNTYTVKRGDSLSLIVQRKYGLSSLTETRKIVAKIEKINNLGNSNMISVGQQLILP